MNRNEKIEVLNEVFNELCNIKNCLREAGFENPSELFSSLRNSQRLVAREIKKLKCAGVVITKKG